jgi:hypothetical protein
MARKTVDVSHLAICDDCDAIFTRESPDVGGLLFERKALCPTCAPKWEESAAKHGEEHYIRDRAKEGEKFFDAVMRWRGGNHSVVITGSAEFVAGMTQRYVEKGGKC